VVPTVGRRWLRGWPALLVVALLVVVAQRPTNAAVGAAAVRAYLPIVPSAVYGRGFVRRAAGLGIDTILTPVRAPRANAVRSAWSAPYAGSASTTSSS
jgi:hypothetical protein